MADLALRAAGVRARPSALRSRSAPAGALQSPNYTAPHQPQWPNYDGPNSIARGYERNTYAMRCMQTIANSVSGLEFKAGNAAMKAARPTAPLAQLLGPPPGAPNTRWSAAQLINYAVIQYYILGKWAWLHEYDDAGRIVGLWPLQAQYLVPIRADYRSGRADGYFEKYAYGQVGMPNYREFRVDDVSYFYRPSQRDLSQPESRVNLGALELNVYTLLGLYDKGFLENGGIPAHLVVTPPWATRDDRSAFRRQFRRDYTGPANANKVMFAERDVEPGEQNATGQQSVEVLTLGQSQKDSQLDVLRDSKIADICVLFGVPLSLLGDSRLSKYTNMATDRENYWQETIKPLVREMADMINASLAPRLSTTDVGWFDLDAVPELRPKPLIDPQYAPALVESGIVTADEIRKLNWQLEPLPDDAFPAPAAEPAPSEPQAAVNAGAGDDVPKGGTGNVIPMVSARSVRQDHLDIVRGLLAAELADQRSMVERRRDGRCGGRWRSKAALSLANAYDTEHWCNRMTRHMAPALRAVGLSDGEIENWSEDITGAVFDRLAEGDMDAFDVDAPMNQLEQLLHGDDRIPVSTVQSALLRLAGQP